MITCFRIPRIVYSTMLDEAEISIFPLLQVNLVFEHLIMYRSFSTFVWFEMFLTFQYFVKILIFLTIEEFFDNITWS